MFLIFQILRSHVMVRVGGKYCFLNLTSFSNQGHFITFVFSSFLLFLIWNRAIIYTFFRWMGHIITLFGQTRSVPLPCTASHICRRSNYNAYESGNQRHWIAQGTSHLWKVSSSSYRIASKQFNTVQFRFQIRAANWHQNEFAWKSQSFIDPLVI